MTYRARNLIDLLIDLADIDLADRARLPWRFHARRAHAVLPG